jgi:hypothetical protein
MALRIEILSSLNAVDYGEIHPLGKSGGVTRQVLCKPYEIQASAAAIGEALGRGVTRG